MPTKEMFDVETQEWLAALLRSRQYHGPRAERRPQSPHAAPARSTFTRGNARRT